MYLKLALKNMKQSTKDYLIYMITLVLSVAMFYGFFSIASPYYSNMLPISIHMEILNKAMRIAVPAVGILILFLVSYVNRYMLKRKQKEFALQTIIGMEQRTVAWIFFLENVMIGAIALILGILSGTMLSQLINAAVLKAFKQEFKLYFMLFPDTVLGTVCFFGIIFFITGLKNVRIIRKMKIIDMLQNSQKGTQILNLHQQFGKFSWCVVALSVVILAMIFPIVSIKKINIIPWMKIGGTIITALGNCMIVCWFFIDRRKKKTGSLPLLCLTISCMLNGIFLLLLNSFFETLVQKGIALQAYVTMPPLIALFFILFAVISFFGNLTWIIIKATEKNRCIHYNNLFFVGQLKSRLGNCTKTMGIITVIMLAAIVLFVWFPIMAVRIHSYQQVMSAFDVQLGTMYTADLKNFPTGTLDYEYIKKYLEKKGYPITLEAQVELFSLGEEKLQSKNEFPVLAVSVSDYNAIRKLSNLPEIQLKEDEYGVAWEHKTQEKTIRNFDKAEQKIKVENQILSKAKKSDYKEKKGIGLFTSKTEGVYIIPDKYCRKLPLAVTFFAANTEKTLPYETAKLFEQDMEMYQKNLNRFSEEQLYIRLQTIQENEGISNMLLLSLIGSYSAMVLIVMGLTMLSIQQMTDAVEQKQRFQIIEKMGVDQRTRNRYIRQQMMFWFGLPVAVAVVGSVGTLVFLIYNSYKEIIAYLTMSEILQICGGVYVSFAIILVGYFSATYYLFKRNLTYRVL